MIQRTFLCMGKSRALQFGDVFARLGDAHFFNRNRNIAKGVGKFAARKIAALGKNDCAVDVRIGCRAGKNPVFAVPKRAFGRYNTVERFIFPADKNHKVVQALLSVVVIIGAVHKRAAFAEGDNAVVVVGDRPVERFFLQVAFLPVKGNDDGVFKKEKPGAEQKRKNQKRQRKAQKRNA